MTSGLPTDGAEPALRDQLRELIRKWRLPVEYLDNLEMLADITMNECADDLEAVLASSQRPEKETK